MTSTSGTGAPAPWPCSCPARTSRFSLWRRMTVARWSILNRVASRSGSCSLDSSSSMTASWRSTSPSVRSDSETDVVDMMRRCSSRPARSCVSSASSASRPEPSASLRPMSRRASASRPAIRVCRETVWSRTALRWRTTSANSSLRPVKRTGSTEPSGVASRAAPRRRTDSGRVSERATAVEKPTATRNSRPRTATSISSRVTSSSRRVASAVARCPARVDSTDRMRSMRAVRAGATVAPSSLRSAEDSVGRSVSRLR